MHNDYKGRRKTFQPDGVKMIRHKKNITYASKY